jgi:hypothetical protein
MKRRIKAWCLALIASIAFGLQACGHGGTEVGNPPSPLFPSTESPGSAEDSATPTPTPEANLRFDETGDENEIALNPEETE